jgi:single-strand DNA-binding protein
MIVNHVMEMGVIAEAPRTSITAKGAMRTSFRLAVPTGFSDRAGKRTSYYFTVVVWRKLAKKCAKVLHPGCRVVVTGKLTARSYEDAQGIFQYAVEIEADDVALVAAKEDHGD